MAEVAPEKSRGLKFAEQQLLRHGWEHGKGLGRGENGISEAIKVKVKCDKGGVGHKEGEQFTFHWWDHVFNKASASLQVESDQNGVLLKKTPEEDEDGMISNKKPRKATLAKAKLYGCFVKSATLLSGQEQPEPKTSNADDSSSSSSDDDDDDEEEDQRLDLSSTTKLSDADLMKVCGGRTAHKGARHGLTMSAKLARLEQQEAEFMAKYGKKSREETSSPAWFAPSAESAEQSPERPEETAKESKRQKMKRKKSAEANGDDIQTEHKKKKKKKKKGREDVEETSVAMSTEQLIHPENGDVDDGHMTKRKKKKKSTELITAAGEAKRSDEAAETDAKIKKKKKKKSKLFGEPVVNADESNDAESNQAETAEDGAPNSTKKQQMMTSEEAEVQEGGSTTTTTRKDCKEGKRASHDQALPPKIKKKKKKSKE